jgi:acetoin utilization deacetylase AcuC-like enzyme
MLRTLFYTDHYHIPLPPEHKFPMQKYRLTRELLQKSGEFKFIPAPLADPEIIKLVHDAAYVEAVLKGTLSDAAQRRIGFPWSLGFVQRTLGSVGSTLAATEEALNGGGGWGGTLAGGTHHAFRAEGSGFCVFNDIAVAIASLRSQGRIGRAAVVDLDVHQGDGTAQIFADDADVLTASVHCRSNFPFRKQQSRIDIELPDRMTDPEYLRVIDDLLPQVLAFEPEVIFYQAGVDGLATDTLGHLALTHAGLVARDRRVMTAAKNARVPLVVTQGGGYSKPIELTAQAHANTFLTALEVFG